MWLEYRFDMYPMPNILLISLVWFSILSVNWCMITCLNYNLWNIGLQKLNGKRERRGPINESLLCATLKLIRVNHLQPIQMLYHNHQSLSSVIPLFIAFLALNHHLLSHDPPLFMSKSDLTWAWLILLFSWSLMISHQHHLLIKKSAHDSSTIRTLIILITSKYNKHSLLLLLLMRMLSFMRCDVLREILVVFVVIIVIELEEKGDNNKDNNILFRVVVNCSNIPK